MEQIENKIRGIMAALRGVSVQGPDNWRRMTAVYQALDEVQYELAEMKKADENAEE